MSCNNFISSVMERRFVKMEWPNRIHCFLKSPSFRDITPCSPLKVNRCFGSTCYLPQGRRISLWLCLLSASCWILAWLILRTWTHIPPKRLLTFNGLHGVIFQNIGIFISTTVITSNHTHCFIMESMNLWAAGTITPKSKAIIYKIR
jgi:hypothetical protein